MNRVDLAPSARKLLRRARGAADRLGYAGSVGVAILVSCGGYFAGQVQPLRQHIEALQTVEPTRQAAGPRPPEATDRLRGFAERFPDEREVAPTLAQIYRLADREGLRLAQGEYRFVRADALGMVQYQVTLPVTGTYPQVRALISAVIENVPWAAVTQVQLRRERVGRGDVEARIGMSLHLRAGGARSAQDTNAPARVSSAGVAADGAVR